MTDREQEKLKKEIEQLRRKPENKRCANCESLAVPYICLDFGTFICTRCAAIHREFAHRAKSITASKFKPEEIAFLKGNAADAAYYLANWNEQIFKLPSAGNEDNARARDFIHMKYEQKRWIEGSQQPQQQQAQEPQQPAVQGFEGQAPEQPLQEMQPAEPMQQMPFEQPQEQQQVVQQQPARPAVEDPFADMFGGSAPVQQPAEQPVQQPVQQQFQQPVEQQFQEPMQPQFEQQAPEQFQEPAERTFQEQPETFAQPANTFAQPQPEQFQQQQQFEPAPEQFQQPAQEFEQPTFQQTAFTSTSAKFNPAAFVQPEQQGSTEGQKGYDMFSDLVSQSANAPSKQQQKPAVSAQAPKPKPAGGDLLDF